MNILHLPRPFPTTPHCKEPTWTSDFDCTKFDYLSTLGTSTAPPRNQTRNQTTEMNLLGGTFDSWSAAFLFQAARLSWEQSLKQQRNWYMPCRRLCKCQAMNERSGAEDSLECCNFWSGYIWDLHNSPTGNSYRGNLTKIHQCLINNLKV